MNTKITFTKNDCGTFCVAYRQGNVVGIRYFTPFDNRDIPSETLRWLKEVR